MTALEIRRDVEGYSGMNEDAFARRFYADRAELESLGIQLTVERPVDGVGRAGELLAAAGELPPPRRSPSPTPSWRRCRRRCSCWTASSPTPSRCAWRCSRSPGGVRARSTRPSSRRSRWASPPRPAATSCRSGWPRSRRRSSATRRSPSTTTRWSATRSAPRKVDPYHLLYRGGQFYLAGLLPRARRAARVPPLADPRQGRVRDEGRARLQAPDRLRSARLRQPRRMAVRRPVGTAEIRIAERHRLAGRAPLRPLRRGRRHGRDDGRPHASHAYGNSRQLRRGCCGLGEHARVARPAGARREAAPAGRAAASPRARRPSRGSPSPRRPAAAVARGRPARARANGGGRAARRGDPPRAVRPAGHARLDPDRRRPGRRAAGRGRAAASRLQLTEPGAARGRQRAERRQLRRRLVRALRRGRATTGRSRSTPSPTATTSPAPPGSCRSRPRRCRGDRPDRRAHPRGVADRRAREDRRRARRGSDGAGPPGRRRQRRRLRRGPRRLQAIVGRRLLRARLLQGERGRVLRPPRRALRADQRPRGLVRRRRTTPPARTSATSAWTGSSRAEVTDERFDAAAGGRPVRRRRRLAADRRGPGLAPARVWISPERARWAREQRKVVEELRRRFDHRRAELRRRSTGSCARCSRRPATPSCSSPPDARAAVLAAAERLFGAVR